MGSSNRDFMGNPLFLYDLLLNTPSVIIGANALGKIISITTSTENLLGYTQAELIGQNLTTIIPERYLDRHKKAFARWAETGELTIGGRAMRLTALHKNGTEIPVELTLGSFRGSEGDLRCIGMMRSMAEIVELEAESKELQAQLEFARSLTSSVTEGIMAWDKDGIVTFLNPAGERILGYKEEEILGKKSHEILHQKKPDGSIVLFNKCHVYQTLQDGKPKTIPDDYYQCKDGSFINVEIRTAPIKEDGNIVGVVQSFRDIAPEKKIRAAQDDLQKKYRMIVDNSTDMISISNMDGIVEYVNPAHRIVLGYEESEIIGSRLSDFIHPEDHSTEQESFNYLKLLSEGGRLPLIEARMRHKDGHYLWVEGSGAFIKDVGEVQFLASYRDITARKDQQQEMSEIFESVPVILWVALVDGAISYYNKLWYEYTGMNHNKTIVERWEQVIHPDDHANLMSNWRNAIKSGKKYEVQARIRRYDGEYRWHIIRAEPISNSLGNITKWIGTSADIEDTKKFGETEERLAAIVNNAGIAIISITLDSLILDWNIAAEELFQWKREEVLGKQLSVIIPQDKKKEAQVIINRVRQGKKVAPISTYRVRKDGMLIDVILSAVPIRDSQGNVTSGTAFMRPTRGL